jgi:hypothetical protein
VLGLGDDPGVPQVTLVGEQRVREVVGALVRLGVGKARSAEEREPDGMPEDVVAVFGLVEQGHPVAGLTQIRPPVAAHLEARSSQLVLATVGRSRWPCWISKVARVERTETGKATFKNRCRSCHSTSVWNSSRRVPAVSRMVWVMVEAPKERMNLTRATQRMALHHLDRVHGYQVGDLVEIGAVDVPGVESARMVVVELEQVAALTVGQHLTARDEIPHRGQQAVTVPLHSKESVVQPALADGHLFSATESTGRATLSTNRTLVRTQGQRTVGQLDHLGPVGGRRVERHEAHGPISPG